MFLIPYLVTLGIWIGIWVGRNYLVLDRFVPLTTQSGYALYEAFGPEATGGTIGHRMALPPRGVLREVEYDALLRRKAFENVRPLRVARLALEKQRRFWSVVPHAEEYRSPIVYAATLCFVPVLALFIMGVWQWRSGAGWLLLPIAYYALLHTVFIGSIRYRLPIEPLLILLAAWGAGRNLTGSR